MATTPPNTDYQRYLRLIRKLRGGEALDKNELSFVVEFKQDVDSGALDKVRDSAEFKKLTPDEQASLSREALDASTALLFQSPEYKESLVSLAKDAEQGKLSSKITTGLNLALAGTDILTSIGQTNTAKNASRRSRRPGRPAPLTQSPELTNAINQAQSGNFDAARAIAPAQKGILDQYLSDLAQARTASTGQAGSYGALGQVAANRRNEANLGLAPIADSITARNQGRLDNLLGMRLGENQAIQQSQAQNYPYDLRQYQIEQDAIGAAGAAGRENLRSSLTGFGSFLPQALAEMATKKRYSDIYNTMSQYGPENAALAGKTAVDVSNRHNGWTNLVDPEYLNQLYES